MAENHEEEFEPISTFWSLIVPPNDAVNAEYPEDSNLILTSACLAELPENYEKSPVRLFADVTTLEIGEDFDGKEQTHKNKLLIATLIPGEKEFQQINFTFTPLNKVQFTVQGAYEIHIVGSIEIIDEEEEDFYDEEEECHHHHSDE